MRVSSKFVYQTRLIGTLCVNRNSPISTFTIVCQLQEWTHTEIREIRRPSACMKGEQHGSFKASVWIHTDAFVNHFSLLFFLSTWNQLLSRNALWGNRGNTWKKLRSRTFAACTEAWTLSFSSPLFIFKANRTSWGSCLHTARALFRAEWSSKATDAAPLPNVSS